MMERLPCLRSDLDFISLRAEDQDVILVRDSLGLVRENLLLRSEAAGYLGFFDGLRTARDLQDELGRIRGGVSVSREEIDRLVEHLDELGLLQTDRYRQRRDTVIRHFSENPHRPSALAGNAYSGEAGELAGNIDTILALSSETGPGDRPSAIAVPHIDLRVSGATYSRGYNRIRGKAPSSILILGTGHALAERYSLTDKTFETPLGEVTADGKTVNRLRSAAASVLAGDDFAHRSEHSIEFQLLFLQRLYAMEKVPIVPLLCGSFDDFFREGRNPGKDPGIAALVRELRSWLDEPPAGKLIVAGVDLSHVGPKFGDSLPAQSLEREFSKHDRLLLDALEAGDSEAFFEAGRKGEQYRVCGFSALWTLLALLPGVEGEVLDYTIWHEKETASAVSFGAVAFTG